MAEFPTLSIGFDSTSYKVSRANPAYEGEDTDGGYVVGSRPRYTRSPPRTFTFKFVNVSHADRVTLEAFWETVKGSSVIFQWRDPTTAVLHDVRFTKGMMLEFERTGYGTNHRYDTGTVSMTEV